MKLRPRMRHGYSKELDAGKGTPETLLAAMTVYPRPPKVGRVAARIPDDIHARVQAVADRYGWTITEFLDRAIRAALEAFEEG